jgi:hypothetical protein
MQDAILVYFAGEKHAAAAVALAGLAALVAAVVLLHPRWDLRGLAVVTFVFALLELSVGVGLLQRTGPQVDALLTRLADDPAGMLADEGARMARVQAMFVRLEIFWLTLIAGGAAIALTQRGRPILWSAALGFLLHAAFLFVFDAIAERRGAIYLSALTRGHPPGA